MRTSVSLGWGGLGGVTGVSHTSPARGRWAVFDHSDQRARDATLSAVGVCIAAGGLYWVGCIIV